MSKPPGTIISLLRATMEKPPRGSRKVALLLVNLAQVT